MLDTQGQPSLGHSLEPLIRLRGFSCVECTIAEYRLRLRACLVSNRGGLGGAKSASFTRGTASREPFLRGSFFGFRSVSSKESPQRGPPRTPENAKKLNPHPYQTGSYNHSNSNDSRINR